MKRLAALLLFVGCGYGSQEHYGMTLGVRHHNFGGKSKTVTVMTCDGKYARIFVDHELTMPMANPIKSDKYGSYYYYTDKGDCTQETIR